MGGTKWCVFVRKNKLYQLFFLTKCYMNQAFYFNYTINEQNKHNTKLYLFKNKIDE